MGELVALAVHGDAFVHRRANGTILVDGGGSSTLLAAQLVKLAPKLDRIDVVVCTHADLDHANGLRTILTSWRAASTTPVTIGEFWLPGRWLEVAKAGLTDPETLMSSVVRALDSGALKIARALFWAEGAEDDGTDEGEQTGGPREIDGKRLAQALRHPDVQVRLIAAENGRSDHHDEPPANSEPPAEANGGKGESHALEDGRIEVAVRLDQGKEKLSSHDVRGIEGILATMFPGGERPTDDAGLGDVEAELLAEPWEPDWARDMRRLGAAPSGRVAAARAFGNARRRVVYRMGHHRHLIERGLPVTVGTSVALGRYCLALIDAAEAIVEIARHAIATGVPIRWFDYDAFADTTAARGGRSWFLLPMNAVEVRSPPVVQMPDAVFYLALSKANRESLVFYAPAEAGCRGVVFSGDSRLGYGWGGAMPFQAYSSMKGSRQVGTAPHHAAESASPAYAHAPLFGIDRWVCAANGRTTPGPTYRAIAHDERCCTACPLIAKPLAIVSLDLDESHFVLPGGCTCA